MIMNVELLCEGTQKAPCGQREWCTNYNMCPLWPLRVARWSNLNVNKKPHAVNCIVYTGTVPVHSDFCTIHQGAQTYTVESCPVGLLAIWLILMSDV